ncbi:hypothetical protein KX816_00925 [Sphingosinicellaceae bacterium]|nr:hypothetical protein KX816_00925 [Sphingosinicellaceae bacterium]
MESRPSLVTHLQHLAALPAHSGPEVVQAALLTLMLDAAAAEQAMISESLARLKAIDQVRLAGNVDQDTRDAWERWAKRSRSACRWRWTV